MSENKKRGPGERKFENVGRIKLVNEISNENELSPKVVEKILVSFFGKVKRYVNEGKSVELRQFGSFSALKSKREGLYPYERATFDEERSQVKVKFKPSKYFITDTNNIQEK